MDATGKDLDHLLTKLAEAGDADRERVMVAIENLSAITTQYDRTLASELTEDLHEFQPHDRLRLLETARTFYGLPT